MRAFILSVFHFSFMILLLLGLPAAAEFADAAGVLEAPGAAKQCAALPQPARYAGVSILEVVGNCGEGLQHRAQPVPICSTMRAVTWSAGERSWK